MPRRPLPIETLADLVYVLASSEYRLDKAAIAAHETTIETSVAHARMNRPTPEDAAKALATVIAKATGATQ